MKKNNICIIGCGYVGLPLIDALSKNYNVTGYDINLNRIQYLKKKYKKKMISKNDYFLNFTNNFNNIKKSNIYIITLPTPLNSRNLPDLKDIIIISKKISKILKKNDLVIYESTVFPGATEEIFLPNLTKFNNLKLNKDFWVGYSPERINPGDKKYNLSNIVKITSASNKLGLKKVNSIYSKIIKAGLHPVENIKIAELSKVLENTQRFVNIALVNEISVLCRKLSINSKKVLTAASTKWNFINFKPGLVGGHCIAVDPLYLFFKSKNFNFPNDLILSSQKINRYIPKFIVNEMMKNKFDNNKKTLILGLTFKENCKDTRNSGVFEIIKNLNKNKIIPDVFDYNLKSKPENKNLRYNFIHKVKRKEYNNIILAVIHSKFKKLGIEKIKKFSYLKNVKVFDIKSAFKPEDVYFQL